MKKLPIPVAITACHLSDCGKYLRMLIEHEMPEEPVEEWSQHIATSDYVPEEDRTIERDSIMIWN